MRERERVIVIIIINITNIIKPSTPPPSSPSSSASSSSLSSLSSSIDNFAKATFHTMRRHPKQLAYSTIEPIYRYIYTHTCIYMFIDIRWLSVSETRLHGLYFTLKPFFRPYGRHAASDFEVVKRFWPKKKGAHAQSIRSVFLKSPAKCFAHRCPTMVACITSVFAPSMVVDKTAVLDGDFCGKLLQCVAQRHCYNLHSRY